MSINKILKPECEAKFLSCLILWKCQRCLLKTVGSQFMTGRRSTQVYGRCGLINELTTSTYNSLADTSLTESV